MHRSPLALCFASVLALACWSDPRGTPASTPPKRATDTPDVTAPSESSAPPSATPTAEPVPAGDPRIVGLTGIGAWDSLAASEKKRVTSFSSFFLHQSVGGDLEDGAEAVGYKFEYATSDVVGLATGLNGGLFATSNGNPSGKIAEFRRMALANRSTARVAIMKFGYADIVADKLAGAQTDYQTAVAAIKAAGVRVLHVTPPLVYAVPEENAPKTQPRFRAWR